MMFSCSVASELSNYDYLSRVYYSDTCTLTETPNTIENIFRYTRDVTENNKASRFLQVWSDCRNACRFIDAHSN